jgi:hypothetical protein
MMGLKDRTTVTFGAPNSIPKLAGRDQVQARKVFQPCGPGQALETLDGAPQLKTPLSISPTSHTFIGSPKVIRRRNRIMSVGSKPSQSKLACELRRDKSQRSNKDYPDLTFRILLASSTQLFVSQLSVSTTPRSGSHELRLF